MFAPTSCFAKTFFPEIEVRETTFQKNPNMTSHTKHMRFYYIARLYLIFILT
jgi:hypothetical protein